MDNELAADMLFKLKRSSTSDGRFAANKSPTAHIPGSAASA